MVTKRILTIWGFCPNPKIFHSLSQSGVKNYISGYLRICSLHDRLLFLDKIVIMQRSIHLVSDSSNTVTLVQIMRFKSGKKKVSQTHCVCV